MTVVRFRPGTLVMHYQCEACTQSGGSDMPAEVAARHLLEHDKVTISRSIANFIHDSLQPGTNEVKVVFSDLGSISVSVEEISAGTAGDVRTGVWRRTSTGRWNYWYGTDGWVEDMTLTALRSFTTV